MASNAQSFFDADKVRPRRDAPDVGRAKACRADDDGPAGMSVWQLVGRIKSALAEAFPKRVTVVGEISNCSRHTSGHVYFRLKDSRASIDAVMFRSHASKLRFAMEDGMEVVVEGRVDVYDARGQLQLYAERITPRGAGVLELALRQLTEKLAAEGLFDADRKQPLPRFPRAIGIVTSPTGAAIRDIGRTIRRRWPAAKVYLLGTLVQGEGAAAQIAAAIAALDASAERLGIDVLIVARGGGSIEDLWAFNEEPVARAIASARTPVISGVGHEVDFTIADRVADVRAATPTAAAELAVPSRDDIARRLSAIARRLASHAAERLSSGKRELAALARSVIFRDPARLSRSGAQRLDELAGRLRWALGAAGKRPGERLSALAGRLQAGHPRNRLELARQQVQAIARQMESMSYRATLRRGFTVTRDQDGRILRSAEAVRVGDRIETELVDGRVISLVGDRRPASHRASRRAQRPPADHGPGLFDQPRATDEDE